MKNYFKQTQKLAIIAFASIVLFSCSSDDTQTVVENQAPNSFNLLEVADGALDVDLQPRLTWESATDPDGDPVSYDFYIGTENPPMTKMASGLTTTYYIIQEDLAFNTLYYWKVIAKDNQGNSTESNTASFKTRIQTNQELLVGKWFLDSIEDTPPLSACRKTSYFQFLENGSFLAKNYDEDSNGDCVLGSSRPGTYEINANDELVVNFNNGTGGGIIQILTLTNDQLTLLDGGYSITFKRE